MGFLLTIVNWLRSRADKDMLAMVTDGGIWLMILAGLGVVVLNAMVCIIGGGLMVKDSRTFVSAVACLDFGVEAFGVSEWLEVLHDNGPLMALV